MHIERKAMHRHPSTHMHSDSADLTSSFIIHDPYSCISLHSLSSDPKVSYCPYDHLLQLSYIAMQIMIVLVQIEYRVSRDLSRTMISNITSSIDFEERDTTLLEFFF